MSVPTTIVTKAAPRERVKLFQMASRVSFQSKRMYFRLSRLMFSGVNASP